MELKRRADECESHRRITEIALHRKIEELEKRISVKAIKEAQNEEVGKKDIFLNAMYIIIGVWFLNSILLSHFLFYLFLKFQIWHQSLMILVVLASCFLVGMMFLRNSKTPSSSLNKIDDSKYEYGAEHVSERNSSRVEEKVDVKEIPKREKEQLPRVLLVPSLDESLGQSNRQHNLEDAAPERDLWQEQQEQVHHKSAQNHQFSQHPQHQQQLSFAVVSQTKRKPPLNEHKIRQRSPQNQQSQRLSSDVILQKKGKPPLHHRSFENHQSKQLSSAVVLQTKHEPPLHEYEQQMPMGAFSEKQVNSQPRNLGNTSKHNQTKRSTLVPQNDHDISGAQCYSKIEKTTTKEFDDKSDSSSKNVSERTISDPLSTNFDESVGIGMSSHTTPSTSSPLNDLSDVKSLTCHVQPAATSVEVVDSFHEETSPKIKTKDMIDDE